MLFRRLVILFIASLAINSIGAQQNDGGRILFRGVVVSAQTSERLPGSQIFINNTYKTSSREDGTFSLFASRFDTITFTMLGFRKENLVVNDSLRSKEFLTGVYLQTDTIQIGEVIIIPRFSRLMADLAKPGLEQTVRMDNARSNISIASYQGRSGQGRLGDPALNYEVLRQKQRTEAYEKGGIPSDRIVGLSPFMLIPAAYLLMHGLPEKAEAPDPGISKKDVDELYTRYLESIRGKK
jgi:hypothetical protein